MNNGKTISLKSVLWRVLRNPIVKDITYEEAAEITLEYIKSLGAPLIFGQKTEIVEINEHKGAVPLDLVTIQGVRFLGEETCDYDCAVPMRYASNLYHTNPNEHNDTGIVDSKFKEFTYIIQNGIIQTSIEKGFVEISYKAVMTDDEGFPVLVDNEKVIRGLVYYIIFTYIEGLWSVGKIPDKVFHYYEQKKLWNVGSAQSDLKMLSIDQMETLVNSINRLIINDRAYDSFYKNFGQKEKIKKYN